MPESFVNIFERPDLAIANALEGNLRGAGYSLYNPEALSPHERRTVAERWFGGDPGPMRELLKITTNPLIILGAILTVRYPVEGETVPKALQSFDYLKKPLATYIPFLDATASFDEIYRGTPLPDLIHELGRRMHETQNEGQRLLGRAFDAYAEKAGKPIDARSWNRVVGALDETTNPLNPVWDTLREAYKDSPEDLAKIDRLLRQAGPQHVPYHRLDPAEKELVKGIRKFYNWHWERSGADAPGMTEALLKKLQSKRFKGTERIGKFVDNYWARMLVRTPEEAQQFVAELSDAVVGGGKQEYLLRLYGNRKVALTPSEFIKMQDYLRRNYAGAPKAEFEKAAKEYLKEIYKLKSAGAAEKVASLNKLMRFNKSLPDARYLQAMGGPFQELAGFVENATYVPPGGGPPVPIPQYRLGTQVLQAYNHQSARDFGWSVIPKGGTEALGTRIMSVMNQLGDGVRLPDGTVRKYPLRKAFMRDTFLPTLLRDSQYEDFLASAKWSGLRERAAELMTSPAAQKWIPASIRKSITEGLQFSPLMSGRGMATRLANYFYGSTLAFPNFIAPLKNLGQTILTTYPALGWKYTIHGLRETTDRFKQYVHLRWGPPRLDRDAAARKAFAGFRQTDLDMDEALMHTLTRLENRLGRGWGQGKLRQTLSDIHTFMMGPFSATERFNRLVGFYGARKMMLDHVAGKTVPDAITGTMIKLEKTVSQSALDNWTDTTNRLAQWVNRKALALTSEMHFGGGVTNVPRFAAKWPPLLKQLMTFPVRFANYFLRGGLGRKGRILLASGIGVGLAAMLLGDEGERMASEATLFGALPTPYENNPFSPFPLVPPALQIVGSAAQAAMGDPTNLGKSTALLIPGGIGLSRILGTQTETGGKLFRKPWADYQHRAPDGRVPLRHPDGALIGYYSDLQLWVRSLGLGDVTGAQEAALVRWMLGHRDRLAALRREYVDALADNDQRAADAIEAQYKKMFPGLGPMPLKKSHLRALHLRRDVSRLERVLETMPPEIRNQFAAAASLAMAHRGPGFLGVEPPGLLGGGTVRSREALRRYPPSRLPPQQLRPGDETVQQLEQGQGLLQRLGL